MWLVNIGFDVEEAVVIHGRRTRFGIVLARSFQALKPISEGDADLEAITVFQTALQRFDVAVWLEIRKHAGCITTVDDSVSEDTSTSVSKPRVAHISPVIFFVTRALRHTRDLNAGLIAVQKAGWRVRAFRIENAPRAFSGRAIDGSKATKCDDG